MALGTALTFQPPPFNFRTTGIVLSLVPGDASLGIEIERAPDNGSGAPNTGASVSIATGFVVPPSGGLFRDLLPLDGQKRFYRARQHGNGYDPGPWTAWTAGHKPVPLSKSLAYGFTTPDIAPAVLTPLMAVADDAITQPNIAPLAVGEPELITQAVQRRILGAQTVQDLATITGRSRFINGDAEDGRSYWNSNPSGQGNTTLTVVNDFDTISGAYSFKLAHTANQQEYFYQSSYPGVEPTDPANWLYFRVRPSSRIQVTYTSKVSAANVIGRVYVAEYAAGGGLLSTTQIGSDVTSLTPVTREAEYTVGSSTFYVVVRFAVEGTSSGYAIYDELYFIDLIPFTDTLMDWVNLGLKSAGFTVDWKNGWSQYAEINGTNLAVTLQNPEPGGRYRLYLKQNSQPDTVTWPTNIKWENNTAPTLSTTTGRVDRIDLEWTGAVYLGKYMGWWPETEQVILPTGIPSGQAFGTTVVDRPHVNPSGIASGAAFGATQVIRDDPVPAILSVAASDNGDGDLCGGGGTVHVTILWSVEDAPDGTHHIDIDGVASDLVPSAGAYVHDTGVGPFNRQGSSEATFVGPYTVRLVQTSGHVEKDSDVTNSVSILYTLEFCA